MELNEPIHNEHEHASVSLKVMLLIFGVILAGTLGYLVYSQNTEVDDTDNSAPKVTTTETKTEETAATTTDETADWKTYSYSKNNLSFMYPPSWTVTVKSEGENSLKENVVVLTIKTDAGASLEMTHPEPGRGYQAWTLSTPEIIATKTSGLTFSRRYGPSTTESGLNNHLYYASAEKSDTDIISFVGQVNSLPTSLIKDLDTLLSTVTH